MASRATPRPPTPPRNADLERFLAKHSSKNGCWLFDIDGDPVKQRIATFVYNELPRRVGDLERVVQRQYGIHSIVVDTDRDQLVVSFTGPSNIYRYRAPHARTTEYLDVFRRDILDVIARDPREVDTLFEHDTDLDVLESLLKEKRL